MKFDCYKNCKGYFQNQNDLSYCQVSRNQSNSFSEQSLTNE